MKTRENTQVACFLVLVLLIICGARSVPTVNSQSLDGFAAADQLLPFTVTATSPKNNGRIIDLDDHADVAVTFDAAGLMEGSYNTTSRVSSDDPDESRVDVPVTLQVGEVQPAPYAFVNQPWDWVEGFANPGATIDSTLIRGGSPIASITTTINAEGRFSFEFRNHGEHIDIVPEDEITISGGGLDATMTVIDIVGGIDAAQDSVVGQAFGGIFPSQGVAGVGLPSDLSLITETVNFDETGRFVVEFGGKVDIGYEHIAKVDYQDPNGNRIVQVFFPDGLDVCVLITEGRVEGVTLPGTTVGVLVSDTNGIKGTATTTASELGFYSTVVSDTHRKISLALGDHVTVMKAGVVREMDLTMYHVSHVQPWNNRIVGTVKGISLPAEDAHGRVDLWSVASERWYTQYVGIGPDGSYGADFNGIVEMTPADMIRVWATASDGRQQAALGWSLDVGVSMSNDTVWGYATVSSTAYITLCRGLENQTPTEILGTASALVNPTGYFSTTVMSNSLVVDIAPSNVLLVQAGEHFQTLFVGLIDIQADVDNNMVLITGPPDTRVHLEGRRPGVLREDAPYQDDYTWREATIGPDGETIVGPLSYDVQVDDWFDITCYGVGERVIVHSLMAVPEETISLGATVYLPLVIKDAG